MKINSKKEIATATPSGEKDFQQMLQLKNQKPETVESFVSAYFHGKNQGLIGGISTSFVGQADTNEIITMTVKNNGLKIRSRKNDDGTLRPSIRIEGTCVSKESGESYGLKAVNCTSFVDTNNVQISDDATIKQILEFIYNLNDGDEIELLTQNDIIPVQGRDYLGSRIMVTE